MNGRAVGALAATLAAVVAGCTSGKTAYETTRAGSTAPFRDANLVAWQRHRTMEVIHTYARVHFDCGHGQRCRFALKAVGTNSYEVTIRRRGYSPYCYRIRFFFKRHHFAGPAQPINCV